jgi:hypothetical protein
MAFWNHRPNWRLIVWPFVIIMWVLMAFVLALDLPILAAGLLMVVLELLSLGLIERGIRQAAKRRFRRALDPEDPTGVDRSLSRAFGETTDQTDPCVPIAHRRDRETRAS